MVTKGEIVKTALDMLAINGALTSASPDTNSKFLRFLEMMISSWTNKGLSIGFKQAADIMHPDASDESGIVVDDVSAVASKPSCLRLQLNWHDGTTSTKKHCSRLLHCVIRG